MTTANPPVSARPAPGTIQVRRPRIMAIYAALDWMEQHPEGFRSQQSVERGGTPGYFTAVEIFNTIQKLRPTWEREGHPAADFVGNLIALRLGLTSLRETRRIQYVSHYYGERRAFHYRAPADARVRAQQPPYTTHTAAGPDATYEFDPNKTERTRELARGRLPRRTLEIADSTWTQARALARASGAESTSDYAEQALRAYNEQMQRSLGAEATRALAEADPAAEDPLLGALVSPADAAAAG